MLPPTVTAGRFFCQNPRHSGARIAQLYMHQLDAKPVRQLSAGPVDIGVDLVVPAPGIKKDSLPLCIRNDGIEIAISSSNARRHRRDGNRQPQEKTKAE